MHTLYWGTKNGRYPNGLQPAAIRKGLQEAEVCAVAWLDEQLVGVATMSGLPAEQEDPEEKQQEKQEEAQPRRTRAQVRSGVLDLLLVHPAFRKVHIATRLWQCLLAHARKLRLTQVRAEIVNHFLRSQKNKKNPLHGFKGTGNDRVLQLKPEPAQEAEAKRAGEEQEDGEGQDVGQVIQPQTTRKRRLIRPL